MPPFLKIQGRKFGKLKVLSFAGQKQGRSLWKCLCDCGKTALVIGSYLKNGNTKSCGCLILEVARNLNLIHGASGTAEFIVWWGMIQRCTNPNHSHFKNYGGRGINVCARWRNSFQLFLSDVGKRPSSAHWLERVDNNKGYEPGNVTWATIIEQASNRRDNHRLTINGITKTIAQWSRETGIPYQVIKDRIRLGWNAEEAVCAPVGFQRNNGAIRKYSDI